MESGMVALSISGLSADIEKEWVARLTEENVQPLSLKSGRKMSCATGAFGLSHEVEREWLSTIGSRV